MRHPTDLPCCCITHPELCNAMGYPCTCDRCEPTSPTDNGIESKEDAFQTAMDAAMHNIPSYEEEVAIDHIHQEEQRRSEQESVLETEHGMAATARHTGDVEWAVSQASSTDTLEETERWAWEASNSAKRAEQTADSDSAEQQALVVTAWSLVVEAYRTYAEMAVDLIRQGNQPS